MKHLLTFLACATACALHAQSPDSLKVDSLTATISVQQYGFMLNAPKAISEALNKPMKQSELLQLQVYLLQLSEMVQEKFVAKKEGKK